MSRSRSQAPAKSQHFQGSEIKFLVAAKSGFDRALAFGEGRGVEDDGVVLLARRGVVLEQVEGVGLDPLDLSADVGVAVELLVLLGHFERGTRGVNSRHLVAHSRQVQRETALIGETIEGFTVSITRSRGVVLALVEEGSSLLATETVEVKAHAVQPEDSRGFLA